MTDLRTDATPPLKPSHDADGLQRADGPGSAPRTATTLPDLAAPEAAAPTVQPLSERGGNRSLRPTSTAFRELIASGWGERPPAPPRAEVADWAAGRRAMLSQFFPGDRLVVPAGPLRVRSNDTDHRFRPHAAFTHLTGLGVDREADAVLVLEPVGDGGVGGEQGHRSELFVRPRAPRDSEEFWSNARYGEFWVGARQSLEEVEVETGLVARHLDGLEEAITAPLSATIDVLDRDADPPQVRLVTAADPAVAALLGRQSAGGEPVATEGDDELVEALSTMRLVKDAFEVDRLREAVAATAAGFEQVVLALPDAVAHRRGERVVETAFSTTARREGNGVGYETIAAAGDHACTLHWTRNDGAVREGDLVLVDAGVEVDSLYTADVTRTLPVSGTFTDVQREVYAAVLDAADAAFAVCRPGATIRTVHEAAMRVIAERLAGWGLLDVGVEEALDPTEGGQHRRWMVHGTSHHLGLDVHDCAQARRETYLDAALAPGMVITIEPGLYLKRDDLLVPAAMRGIGVRIEDDVLVTARGCENLSAALPRTPDAVEAWMAGLAHRQG